MIDLSQEIELKLLKSKEAISGGAIVCDVLDTAGMLDLVLKIEATNLSAGSVAVKIESADNFEFNENVEDVTEGILKTVISNGKYIDENKAEAAKLYFTSSSDKQLSVNLGINLKKIEAKRFLKFTFTPSGATGSNGLDAMIAYVPSVSR